MLDLTPFGFTPTESSSYRSLLELGPSSGYAVARALSIARANAYQALDGLVTKGAAVLVNEAAPKRYRAVQPRALFAAILASENRKLDELERQMTSQPAGGAAPLQHLRGERALSDLAIRAIVRTEGEVACYAPADRLTVLAQAFRAREAAGRASRVLTPDPAPEAFPVAVTVVDRSRLPSALAEGTILLLADGALAATVTGDPSGIWSEAPMFVALVEAAIAQAES